MTKKLEDLFESFPSMPIEKQFEKIQEIRDTRSIERPAVAMRRRKKEATSAAKKQDKAMQLLMNLSEEEREELLKKLGDE